MLCRRRALAVSLALLVSAMAQAAEKLEPIDAEFLEYLAELESSDEDWTLVADGERTEEPAEEKSKSEDSSNEKAADKTRTEK